MHACMHIRPAPRGGNVTKRVNRLVIAAHPSRPETERERERER